MKTSFGKSCVGVGSEKMGATLALGIGVGTTLFVTVGVGEGEEDGVLNGKSTRVGFGEGLAIMTFEPFFQVIFLPDFTQVYLYPPVVVVAPTLGQVDPAFTMASAGAILENPARLPINTAATRRLMASDYAKPNSLNRARGRVLRQLFQLYQIHTAH